VNTLQTLMVLVVLIFVLSVIAQAAQEFFKPVLNNKGKPVRTPLRLGVFMLLALLVVQSQTGNSPPTHDGKKAADAPAKKSADEKAAVDKRAADEAAAKQVAAATATTTGPWHVSVETVANDQLSLDVLALYPSLSDKTSNIPGAACTTQDLMCKRLHLVLTDSVVKDQLKQLHHGDHIEVVYSIDAAKNQNVLKALSVDSVPTGAGTLVILGSMLICFLLYCLFSGFKPWQLIIGEDNRYSNSRFQMALWFFVLITTYVATLWLRVWAAGGDFIGGVDIPKNLLLLSGMSALTFGGAKGITANKDAAPGTPQKTRADKPRFFFDLTHNDYGPPVPAQPEIPAQAAVAAQPAVAYKAAVPAQPEGPAQAATATQAAVPYKSAVPAQPEIPAKAAIPARPAVPFRAAVPAQDPGPGQFDFGDFQMLVITLIAVVTYIVLIVNFFGTVRYSKIVSLPDVDTTLLAAFGLGQGAYLTKKAVGNVGTS